MTNLENDISIRAATPDDSATLLRWRNDPASRMASRNQRLVSQEEHTRWFMNAITSKKHKILICEVGQAPAAVVRFREKRNWEISWIVAPEYRGTGLGTKLVAEAIACTNENITACILRTNVASLRIANKLGFIIESNHGKWIRLTLSPTEN